MNIIGIDIAKSIFHICVMNQQGRVLRRDKCYRDELILRVLNLGKGTIAMEACGGSHYWARCFSSHGYEVKMIAAQFVKPFLKSNKNDTLDAEAICEAASRSQMRYVSMRSEEQQDIQNIHRIRERLVKQRTAISNETRGLLMEYGIVLNPGIHTLRNNLPELINKHGKNRSALWCSTFTELYEELCQIEEKITHYNKQLKTIASSNETCQRLQQIPGVGLITATALVGAVGDARDFKNGRQFAAWLGLTPRQESTGGKPKLGGITKRGDVYIRKLLVQGSCSLAIAVKRKNKHKPQELNMTEKWLCSLFERKCFQKSVVAMANKTARRIWMVLIGNDFKQIEELKYV